MSLKVTPMSIAVPGSRYRSPSWIRPVSAVTGNGAEGDAEEAAGVMDTRPTRVSRLEARESYCRHCSPGPIDTRAASSATCGSRR